MSAIGFVHALGGRRAAALALVATLSGAGCGGTVVFESDGEAGGAGATAAATTASASSGGSCIDGLPGQSLTLALAVQLGPGTPILFLADVTTDGDALLLQLTPLVTPWRRDDVDTAGIPSLTRLHEAAITLTTSPLGPGGAFTFEGDDVRLPSAANPFSPDEIVATLSFSGRSCGSAAPLCGEVSGEVTQPIGLELTAGSNTFAVTTELGGTFRSFVIDCDGTLSDEIASGD